LMASRESRLKAEKKGSNKDKEEPGRRWSLQSWRCSSLAVRTSRSNSYFEVA
jgi:hypothetical protein